MNRRQVLRSAAGLVVGLPFLTSLNRAKAQPVERPGRFVVFWETGGTINNRSSRFHFDAMHPWNDWMPTGPQNAPILGPIHQPLIDHADRLLFLTGVDNMAEPAEHGRADASSLTATRVIERGEQIIAGGPSIDQVLATRLSAAYPVPYSSVDLTVEGHHYGQPSYRAAGEPISREPDPRAAFARLFVGIDGNAAHLAQLQLERRSVLDGVLGGFQRLKRRVSRSDQLILEAHQDHLRAIERRVQAFDAEAAAHCVPPDVARANDLGPLWRWRRDHPDFRQTIAPLQIDIMAQALICGLTHVATFHYPDTIEPFLPIPFQAISPQPRGHSMGHVARELGDPQSPRAAAWRTEMQANRRWKTEQVRRLMDALAPFEDTMGPLLDNTLILQTSEFSNAARHTATDLPVLLAGNMRGALQTGRHVVLSEGGRGETVETHIDYKTDWSIHNLHTTILQVFGFEDDHFGDDSSVRRGPLPI